MPKLTFFIYVSLLFSADATIYRDAVSSKKMKASSNMSTCETLGWVGGFVLDKWLARQTFNRNVPGSKPGQSNLVFFFYD